MTDEQVALAVKEARAVLDWPTRHKLPDDLANHILALAKEREEFKAKAWLWECHFGQLETSTIR